MKVEKLRYDCYGASLADEHHHPQDVMRTLGITYAHATPQSMGDQWWFWKPQGLPDVLPSYLEVFLDDPMESVGYGLSKEKAEELAA